MALYYMNVWPTIQGMIVMVSHFLQPIQASFYLGYSLQLSIYLLPLSLLVSPCSSMWNPMTNIFAHLFLFTLFMCLYHINIFFSILSITSSVMSILSVMMLLGICWSLDILLFIREHDETYIIFLTLVT